MQEIPVAMESKYFDLEEMRSKIEKDKNARLAKVINFRKVAFWIILNKNNDTREYSKMVKSL
jgi:hypothetical protein